MSSSNRWFTLIASAVFVIIGVWMIATDQPFGWGVAGFFGLCLLVAIFEPRLRKLQSPASYRLLITDDEIACEHPQRKRESIRWEDVDRIWHVTTSGGPYLPDEWILLEGNDRGCSLPTEAPEMDRIWDELKRRFPGFDYKTLIRGGTDEARRLCWERQPSRITTAP